MRLRLAHIAALVAVPASCVLDRTGELEPSGAGANSATGLGGDFTVSSGGDGGSKAGCTVATECPASGTCEQATCEGGVCGVTHPGAEQGCSEGGGEVCDGNGNCVLNDGGECANEAQCLSGFCSDGFCCELACEGACEKCDGSGQCNPHQGGTNPEGTCGGICDGAGNCAVGELQWAQGWAAGMGTHEVWSVVSDSVGNVIVAGGFADDIDVGGGTFSNLVGTSDGFIVKLDGSGAYLWSKHFASGGDVAAAFVAVDDDDNVYVLGDFSGSADVGGGMMTAQTRDIFVAKYDAAGQTVFARAYGGPGVQYAELLAVDSTGAIVAAGRHSGTDTDFGGGKLDYVGGGDLFLLKLDSAGDYAFAEGYGSTGSDTVEGLAIDGDDNIVITGDSPAAINLGGGTESFAGTHDVFAAKYDPSGVPIWTESYGDGFDDRSGGLAIDSDGTVILVGHFESTINFGNGAISASNGYDIFVAKLSADGEQTMAVRFGGSNDQRARSVSVDADGNIALTGEFQGALDFGGGPLETFGNFDPFVAKLTPLGVYLWSHSYGIDVLEYGRAISAGGDAVWMTGLYNGAPDFGFGSLASASSLSIFLLKLSP